MRGLGYSSVVGTMLAYDTKTLGSFPSTKRKESLGRRKWTQKGSQVGMTLQTPLERRLGNWSSGAKTIVPLVFLHQRGIAEAQTMPISLPAEGILVFEELLMMRQNKPVKQGILFIWWSPNCFKSYILGLGV